MSSLVALSFTLARVAETAGILDGSELAGPARVPTADELNAITETIIGCAIRVHKAVGPGLLESAYRECLASELDDSGLRVRTEVPVPLRYRSRKLDCSYRLDLLVEDAVIIETKSVRGLAPIHTAQMVTYLRLTGCQVGLIMNFNVKALPDGIKRVVLGFGSA